MHVGPPSLGHPKNIQQLRVGGSCPSHLRCTTSCHTHNKLPFENKTAIESFDKEDSLIDIDIEYRLKDPTISALLRLAMILL